VALGPRRRAGKEKQEKRTEQEYCRARTAENQAARRHRPGTVLTSASKPGAGDHSFWRAANRHDLPDHAGSRKAVEEKEGERGS